MGDQTAIKKLNVVLFIPGHIKINEQVEMIQHKESLRQQILNKNIPWLNFKLIYSFDDLDIDVNIHNLRVDHVFNLLKYQRKGIVFPTKVAIKYAYSLFGNNCLFIRMGQDIDINIDKLINRLNICRHNLNENYIIGKYETEYNFRLCWKCLPAKERNLIDDKWRFIQGNLLIAPIQTWNDYYFKLPESIYHYADDSILSWIISSHNGKLIGIDQFWHHYENNDTWLKGGITYV